MRESVGLTYLEDLEDFEFVKEPLIYFLVFENKFYIFLLAQ